MSSTLRRTLACVAVLLWGASILPARTARAQPPIPTLVAIRAAHHAAPAPRFDRVVFQFSGPLPADVDVGYVTALIGDASGLPVPIAGRAILRVRFSLAQAHNTAGQPTAPSRRAFALPNVMHVVRSGDFEAVVSYGIGLARREQFRVLRLQNPSRVVVDIFTPFETVWVRTYFVDADNVASGVGPVVRPVWRPVIAPSVARGALDRLFAGPTQAEAAQGLVFINSEATGYSNLTIASGIARVRLRGGCTSGGSTITIANEIVPTLDQFASVSSVKIYSPAGQTASPTGTSNSIPACLEP